MRCSLPVAAASLIALTLTATLAARGAAKPGRDWPSFRGIAARGVAEGLPTPDDVERAGGQEREVEDRDPGPRPLQPGHLGRPRLRHTAVSGKPDAELKVGLYGDIDAGARTTRSHTWKVHVPRQEDRQGAVAADRRTPACRRSSATPSRRTPTRRWRPTASTSSRSSAPKGCTLRPRGQAALEEGPRRARLRLLHGARRRSGASPARR